MQNNAKFDTEVIWLHTKVDTRHDNIQESCPVHLKVVDIRFSLQMVNSWKVLADEFS